MPIPPPWEARYRVMTSTTSAERPVVAGGRPGRRALRTVGVLAFWLTLWQVVAMAVGQQIVLASPVEVVGRLAALVQTTGFWTTVAHSLVRIGTGFAVGALVAVVLAALAAAVPLVAALLAPLISTVRATPVVSFIILVILVTGTGRLALVISALMVVPVVYTNTLEGIAHRDVALLEMAAVYRVPRLRRVRAIDVPAVLPFVVAGCETGVGLAWKSGIAAEVIGLPTGSIGERMYQAKIFLSTPDLFAWTLVVVALSVAFERLVRLGLTAAERRWGGAA